jgi:hypothetical protein
MDIRTCPQCNTIFTTDNPQKVYCNLRCRERHKYQVAKSRAKPKVTDPYWGSFTQCFDDLGPVLASQVFDTIRTNDSLRYCAFRISDPDIITNKPNFIDITSDTHDGINHYIVDASADDFDTRMTALHQDKMND